MRIEKKLSKISVDRPLVITIGNFDGVHRGHQFILNKMTTFAKNEKKLSAVITFENHPSEILRPNHPTPLICSSEHKTKLLEEAGIDLLFLLPFTKRFANKTVEQFLMELKDFLPISLFLFGHDAVLGKGRKGNRRKVEMLAQELGIETEYAVPFLWEGLIVSSSDIRSFIQQNEINKASNFLGREYSIYGKVIPGITHGKRLGFPTVNIDVAKLCLPPLGVYAVKLKHKNLIWNGVANLGYAPTLRNDSKPLLEVHLFDFSEDLYGEYVEVFFDEYLRPEKKFSSVDELKAQIAKDVFAAKKLATDERR